MTQEEIAKALLCLVRFLEMTNYKEFVDFIDPTVNMMNKLTLYLTEENQNKFADYLEKKAKALA